MSKLVERLRREAGSGDWIHDVRNDAADRIEALEAALREIGWRTQGLTVDECQSIARRALEEKHE